MILVLHIPANNSTAVGRQDKVKRREEIKYLLVEFFFKPVAL